MSKSEIKIDAPGWYAAQAQLYADGEWKVKTPEKKPEQLTFQQYVFTGLYSTKKEKLDDEVFCPVCGYRGKEQVLDDRVRIYHPGRLHPCRAPEGYEPVLEFSEQLVPA